VCYRATLNIVKKGGQTNSKHKSTWDSSMSCKSCVQSVTKNGDVGSYTDVIISSTLIHHFKRHYIHRWMNESIRINKFVNLYTVNREKTHFHFMHNRLAWYMRIAIILFSLLGTNHICAVTSILMLKLILMLMYSIYPRTNLVTKSMTDAPSGLSSANYITVLISATVMTIVIGMTIVML